MYDIIQLAYIQLSLPYQAKQKIHWKN